MTKELAEGRSPHPALGIDGSLQSTPPKEARYDELVLSQGARSILASSIFQHMCSPGRITWKRPGAVGHLAENWELWPCRAETCRLPVLAH